MQFKTITLQKLPFFVALGLMAVLTSCGSYQYVGYDNDGIYSTNENTEGVVVEQQVTSTSTDDSNYYKNYFAENKAQINAYQSEDEIFTDVDSYSSDYTERVQDTLDERQPYGGWGQDNNSVTINVIDNGFWGWNDPWLWGPGLGWNNWGWNRWGRSPWGWNRWGWNTGWGWNNPWAWNTGWGWNAGFGWGWNNWGWDPLWNNYWAWNNGFYRNSNRYAFNNGRRGSVLYDRNINSLNRSNAAVSRRDYSRSRLSNAATNTRRVRTSNNATSRSNRSIRTNNGTRVTRPSRTMRNSSSTRTRGNNNSARSSRSTRPSRTMSTSRSSSSRSSGSTRSSRSSSSRSSGSMRSSRSSRSSSGSRTSSGGRRGRG